MPYAIVFDGQRACFLVEINWFESRPIVSKAGIFAALQSAIYRTHRTRWKSIHAENLFVGVQRMNH